MLNARRSARKLLSPKATKTKLVQNLKKIKLNKNHKLCTKLQKVSCSILSIFAFISILYFLVTQKSESKSIIDIQPNINIQPKIVKSVQWPLVASNECQALYGNGFSTKIVSCMDEHKNISNNFQCFENPSNNAVYCSAKNLVIDPSKISVNTGGTDIASVANQGESVEFPIYEKNAFKVECNHITTLTPIKKKAFYIKDVLKSIANSDSNLCSVSGQNKLVLLTTRYEYANLYHTATDWYNFYQVLHSLGFGDVDKKQLSIIFLDGHPKGSLDDGWNLNFANYSYIKQITKTICLRNAIFIPAGYTGGLSAATSMIGRCHKPIAYVKEFKNWFLKNLVSTNKFFTKKQDNILRIAIICRQDYIAHPRKMDAVVNRKFANESLVEQIVKNALLSSKSINSTQFEIEKIYLEHMPIKQQFSKLSNVDIMIAAHGAGMTHSLFLREKTVVIEIVSPSRFGNLHFDFLSMWCGHEYFSIKASEKNDIIYPDQKMLFDTVNLAVDKYLQF